MSSIIAAVKGKARESAVRRDSAAAPELHALDEVEDSVPGTTLRKKRLSDTIEAALAQARREYLGSYAPGLRRLCKEFMTRSDEFPLVGQKLLHRAYNSTPLQVTIAGLIVLNFATEAIFAQLVPTDGATLRAFFVLEVLFDVIFTLELVHNMWAHYRLFWRSSWVRPRQGGRRLGEAGQGMGDMPCAFPVPLPLACAEFVRRGGRRLLVDRGCGAGRTRYRPPAPPAGVSRLPPLPSGQVTPGDHRGRRGVDARRLQRLCRAHYLKSTAESAMRTEEGMHGLATSRRSLRTRLVCIVWMLRIGRATYKRQRIAALRLQRAVAHWLRRMRRQRDRPERVAVRLLRGVVAQTIESVYSEREMAALDHRTRLGVLVAIWTNRTTRQLALNQFVICTEAHAKAARLGSHAALVHLIMAIVVKQSAADALQRNPGAAAQS